MTLKEAAEVIGCTTQTIRNMVSRGQLVPRKVYGPYNDLDGTGWRWEFDRKQVEKIRDTPQKVGYPRGRKRKKKGKKA